MVEQKWTDYNIKDLVRSLRYGKSILIYGPNLSVKNGNKNLLKGFADSLDLREFDNQIGISGFENDYPIYNIERKDLKTRLHYRLREYLEINSEPSELHIKLALVPFPIYFSTSIDLLMQNALKRSDINYNFAYYDYNSPSNLEDLFNPDIENPLLFQIFGSLLDPTSCVLTREDRFYLIRSLGQNSGANNFFLPRLDSIDTIVCLGVDFLSSINDLTLSFFLDYNRVSVTILDSFILAKTPQESSVSSHGSWQVFNISNNELNDFIGELYNGCSSSGILRKKERTNVSVTNRILSYLQSGDLDSALSVLSKVINNHPNLKNDITLILHRYETNKKLEGTGLISIDQFNVKKNEIVNSVLYMVDQINKTT